MVKMLLKENHEGAGPAICNKDGSLISSFDIDSFFKSEIERVQRDFSNLIEHSVDVSKDFSIFRSLRKGSESRATEAGVSSRERDLINR